MKIRTSEELIDEVQSEFVWRRKELTLMLQSVNSAKNKTIDYNIRSGVLLLYSHWEGFVKKSCELYLNYVFYKKMTFGELKPCFLALAFKSDLDACTETYTGSYHNEVVERLLNSQTLRANFPISDIIKSRSNLNSEILKDMLSKIGLNFGNYEARSNLIDISLLKNRNNIAHGQNTSLDKDSYADLHAKVTSMMREIKDEIENSAILSSFKL